MESTGTDPPAGRAARLKAWGTRQADRATAAREHHATVDTAFEMVERDGDTGGGIIAGALAYRFFIWLLPLALVLVAGLGFAADAAEKSPEEAASSLGLAGLVSASVAAAADGSGRWYALLVGIPILLYVTRGLLRALIGVHRLVWGEPRSAKLKPSVHATVLLLVYLLGYLMVSVLVSLARATSTGLGIVGATLSFFAFAGLWLLLTTRFPHRGAPWEALVPGALLLGVGLAVGQAAMYYLLGPYVLSKGGTYGALGVAAALLFGLYLISRLMIFGAVVNATLWDRGYVIGGKGRGRTRDAPGPETTS